MNDTESIKFSIITPVFNCENYLRISNCSPMVLNSFVAMAISP